VGSRSPETCNISETGQGPRLLLTTNRKLHIRAFDWCQNQRPWMNLKGHYALCLKTCACFGAHHENLNEDRLYCQRRRCCPMTLDSDNIRFMRIFAGVPWKGGVIQQWGNIKRVFFGLSGATFLAP